MKKRLLVLSLLTVFALGVQAQKARIGVKGGFNFANLDLSGSLSNLVETQTKTDFHIGAYGEFGLGGFALQPEFLFSTKGAKLEFPLLGVSGKTNLTYIEIPILLKKSFAKVLNVHLGPQFGFLVAAKNLEGDDIKEQFKETDLSAIFGVGVDLPGGLGAGARYALGLSNINDTDEITAKNKTFQVYVSYRLFGI